MSLRNGVMPKEAEYKDGYLEVTYENSKRVLVRSVTRRERATLYDVDTLGDVNVNETFNFIGVCDVSFRNCDKCDSMSYLEMRPWVYNIRRCTSKNRCGLNGHMEGVRPLC